MKTEQYVVFYRMCISVVDEHDMHAMTEVEDNRCNNIGAVKAIVGIEASKTARGRCVAVRVV